LALPQSTSRGLNYGFSASLNLFDGFAQNRNEKIAGIQIENSKMQIEQQSLAKRYGISNL
jgi:outer membrane protein TolC